MSKLQLPIYLRHTKSVCGHASVLAEHVQHIGKDIVATTQSGAPLVGADLGSGGCIFTCLLAEYLLQSLTPSSLTIHAVDVNAITLDDPPTTFDLQHHQSDGDQYLLAQESNSHDFLVARHMLHFLDRERVTFREAMRVLRPGGSFFIITGGMNCVFPGPPKLHDMWEKDTGDLPNMGKGALPFGFTLKETQVYTDVIIPAEDWYATLQDGIWLFLQRLSVEEREELVQAAKEIVQGDQAHIKWHTTLISLTS